MGKRSIFLLVCEDPASATGIIHLLLNRLGGKVTFSKNEYDAFNGVDAAKMVDLSIDEGTEELTLSIGESMQQ